MFHSAIVTSASYQLPHHRHAPFGHLRAASRMWTHGCLRGHAREGVVNVAMSPLPIKAKRRQPFLLFLLSAAAVFL
jgi:hypothetical protein